MRKVRKLLAILLCGLLILVAVGCQRLATLEPPPPNVRVPEGKLLPISERPSIVPFHGTDLYSGETVSFEVEGAGRVRLLSFFSPG
ncbi:MAG: hypothetical protein GX033_07685 [Firmicutes bacterium]|nr:hypothetical protein [Bacillota bacterium]